MQDRRINPFEKLRFLLREHAQQIFPHSSANRGVETVRLTQAGIICSLWSASCTKLMWIFVFLFFSRLSPVLPTKIAVQALPHVENDAWRLTFINNANACILFVPFVAYFEGPTLWQVSPLFYSMAYMPVHVPLNFFSVRRAVGSAERKLLSRNSFIECSRRGQCVTSFPRKISLSAFSMCQPPSCNSHSVPLTLFRVLPTTNAASFGDFQQRFRRWSGIVGRARVHDGLRLCDAGEFSSGDDDSTRVPPTDTFIHALCDSE